MMPSADKIFAPVNFFLDDMSANKSRRWKPLHVIQAQSAIVPVNLRSKLDFVRFISASERVPILDLMKVIKEHMDTIKESGVEVFDAATKSVKLVMTETCCRIADFTELQATVILENGSNVNFIYGGQKEDTTICQVCTHVLIIFDYFHYRDIPVTILPWIYLGLGKHLLKFCINKLDDKKKEKLVLHLRSIDQSDFSVAFTSDITKYLDSRQGKDIKQYLQLAPFNFDYAGLEPRFLKMLCKLATISKTIDETKIYTTDSIINLQEELNGYLKQVQENAPDLGKKVKTHMTTHLVSWGRFLMCLLVHSFKLQIDDIRNHGPPKAYRKDQFEKLHCNIRKILFNQNQLARSRDTVRQIADCQILQHILDGGYFKNGGEWVSCGSNVRAIGEYKKRLGCELVAKSAADSICTRPSKLIRKISVLHECQGGHCVVMEKKVSRKVEQKSANVLQKLLKHNEDHNVWIVNKFRLNRFNTC
ncbi:uncharacterized protein LOC135497677 [Lineus longissimus]|uniref:uncharacterized protein LOC135497677 n=1 Tax=Lineus longissimus TaxID=88925 RepID=UPI00315D0BC2